MDPEGFFAASYGDRQLITFVEDAEIDKPPNKPLDTSASSGIARLAHAGTAASLGGAIVASLSTLFVPPLALPLAVGAAAIGVSRFLKKRQQKNPPKGILLIRKSWTPHFVLPPGHPRPQVVFAGHPA